MKVFLSWSGDRSRQLAEALRDFLPEVLQDLEPWMSEHDIAPGQRWGAELHTKLEQCSIGVVCTTRENVSAPWLLFEAGCLAKSVSHSRVIPYLLTLTASDVPFPLAQFQGVEASRDGTLRLLRSCNDLRDPALTPERLDRAFERWWPDLKTTIDAIPTIGSTEPYRSDRVLLEELLDLVRGDDLKASRHGDYSNYSVPRNSVWQSLLDVENEDIERMSQATLDRYVGALRRRLDASFIPIEEKALEEKLEFAGKYLGANKGSSGGPTDA